MRRTNQVSPLWELREWLTIGDAAEYLTSKRGHRVTRADLFQLALDGHLRMAVNLPTAVLAKSMDGSGTRRIDGVWDLKVEGASGIQLLHEIHHLRGLGYVSVEGQGGAVVTRGEQVCELPPDRGATGLSPRPPSTLPADAALVFRMSALRAFVGQHAMPHVSTDVSNVAAPSGSFSSTATGEGEFLGTRDSTAARAVVPVEPRPSEDMSYPARAEWLKRFGLTKTRVSAITGVARKTVQKILDGKPVEERTLEKLARSSGSHELPAFTRADIPSD
jgi:hypothetical protein